MSHSEEISDQHKMRNFLDKETMRWGVGRKKLYSLKMSLSQKTKKGCEIPDKRRQ